VMSTYFHLREACRIQIPAQPQAATRVADWPLRRVHCTEMHITLHNQKRVPSTIKHNLWQHAIHSIVLTECRRNASLASRGLLGRNWMILNLL